MTTPDIPHFSVQGVLFHCWVVNSGEYVWRSVCGLFEAGRIPGGPTCFAKCNGRQVGGRHPSLKASMTAAVNEAKRRVVA